MVHNLKFGYPIWKGDQVTRPLVHRHPHPSLVRGEQMRLYISSLLYVRGTTVRITLYQYAFGNIKISLLTLCAWVPRYWTMTCWFRCSGIGCAPIGLFPRSNANRKYLPFLRAIMWWFWDEVEKDCFLVLIPLGRTLRKHLGQLHKRLELGCGVWTLSIKSADICHWTMVRYVSSSVDVEPRRTLWYQLTSKSVRKFPPPQTHWQFQMTRWMGVCTEEDHLLLSADQSRNVKVLQFFLCKLRTPW